MAVIDPAKMRVTVPDAYLIAIGKVCVQWGILESTADMVISKLAGMEIWDARSKILVNHLSWPLKMDILGSLINELSSEYPRLQGYESGVKGLLKTAQDGRNRIVHGFWSNEDGKITMLRATARGKLKLHMDDISVEQIESCVSDINGAAAALYNLAIGR